MELHRKWLARFAIILVVLNLSMFYSNWRVVRTLQQPTVTTCEVPGEKVEFNTGDIRDATH